MTLSDKYLCINIERWEKTDTNDVYAVGREAPRTFELNWEANRKIKSNFESEANQRRAIGSRTNWKWKSNCKQFKTKSRDYRELFYEHVGHTGKRTRGATECVARVLTALV